MTIKFLRHVIMGDYADYEFAVGNKNLVMFDNLHTALKVERMLKRLGHTVERRGFIEKDFKIKESEKVNDIFQPTIGRGTEE